MELEMNNLTKKFGDFTAVKQLNLSMTRGVYGLLGKNGAGKTTFMRMLCTLLTPTEGNILCDGRDIFKMEGEYRKLLGYLPQDFGFYPEFTVRDYLLYIASIKGLPPAVAKKRTKELLAAVGLEKYAGRKMKKLSGGMKRRAGILDEPTAGLDPNERIRFRNLISEFSEDRLVLLSTHIVSDVEYIANDIWLMNEGEIVRQGTPKQITESMKQKVWECLVEKRAVPLLARQYKISNMKADTQGVQVRVIAGEKPAEYAKEAVPSLEDAFLYYFGEEAGDNHGIL